MKQLEPYRFFWFWLPLGGMAIQIAIEVALDPKTLSILHSEGGPHEFLQFIVIGSAFCVAVRTLTGFPVRQFPWLGAWVGLAALCCFYVAGEEISWGQHLFGWTTPEFWDAINDQHETNFHNTSAWLDQKPRLLLEIGILTGGIIAPILRRFRPALLPARFAAIYPPSGLSIIAGIALCIKIANSLGEGFHISLFERASEVEELYMFYFVLAYLVWLRRRLRVRISGNP